MKKVVIIGSGLGGLECGAMLTAKGFDVTIIEQAAQIGGCLQSYHRYGQTLDTGFHYVGGIEPGQVLYPIFQELGLLNLPWQKLNTRAADRVYINGKHFDLPQGYDNFCHTLQEQFPADKQAIQEYVDLLRSINRQDQSLYTENAYTYLQQHFSSPLLRDVLSGASVRLELNRDTLPLYSFACINNSFVQSAYRLAGGGQQIADHLAQRIAHAGGRIFTKVRAIAIHANSHTGVPLVAVRRSTGIEPMFITLDNNEELPADIVISDIAPAATMQLLTDETAIRPVYRRRMTNLPLTHGIVTTTLLLKPEHNLRNTHPDICDSAVYVHTTSPWTTPSQHVEHLLLHTYPNGQAVDLLTPVAIGDWTQLREHDHQAYEARKQALADEAISLAETAVPNLREMAAHIFTSTPATYNRYLGSEANSLYESAFGIRKDCNSIMTTLLSPKTPVPGLYLTGQNLHLHGILGVSMTAKQTVETILSELNQPDK